MATGELVGESGGLSLDDLAALGEEIAALARAGVPLEAGLAALGRDSPAAWQNRCRALSAALEQGEPIDRALARREVGFSPLAQGVVAAGLRTQRLPEALQGLVESARLRAELRRLTALALVYPLILALVAYFIAVLFIRRVMPEVVDSFDAISTPPPAWLLQLERLRSLPGWAWLVPPALAIVGVAWRWHATRRGRMVEPAWSRRLPSAIPGLRRMLADANWAAYCDLLALLLESGAPLDEALRIAGRASSSRASRVASLQLADAVEQGTPLAVAASRAAYPPLIRWLMTVGQARGSLSGAMRQAAAHYAELARRRHEWLEIVLPLAAVLIVGGLAVVLTALLLFSPWVLLLRRLADGVLL